MQDLTGTQPAVPSSGVPHVFGPTNAALTGFFHAPPLGATRPLAVVLCNPLGFEEASVHRTYRHLADRLAAAGLPTLRFDYDGTGNSPTPSDAPQRMAAWISSIKLAVSEARALTGVERVALIGVRFGASLAAIVGRELGGIDSLVLWAPIVSGRIHVRELRAFRLLKGPKAGVVNAAGEEIGGYYFARETLDDMAAVDLLAGEQRPAARVLLIARGDRIEQLKDERRLADWLEAGGRRTRVLADTGYARMMRDDPYEAVVPFDTLNTIVAWLSEDAAAAARSRSLPSPGARSIPVAVSSTEGALSETAMLFGPESRLFGICTEPASVLRADRPAVCFVNVGANPLAAPHRINVELARQVASLGYLTFRLDLSGLGDSGCVPGVPEGRLYDLAAVADLRQAMDVLALEHGTRGFIVVGLCSGAYVAFHAATQDPRVVGQVLLSPYAFEWKEGDPIAPTERHSFESFHSTRFYLKALFDRRVWLRVVRGDVQVRAIATVLLKRARDRLELALDSAFASLGLPGAARSDVERSFKALSARGVASLLVVGFQDGGLDTISRYLGTDAKKMRGRRNFTLEILNDVDHTFTTLASRRRLIEILKGYLAEHGA